MEPISKTITIYLGLTALMGAAAKIIKDKARNPREWAISLIASITSAYIALLIGNAFGVKEIHMHILVWAGAYMGSGFGELIIEAVKIAIKKRLK